ncbi:MAG: DUF29 domain-containing protein [Crocosphaera sp.]
MKTDQFNFSKNHNSHLYHKDYYLWIDNTVNLLLDKRFSEINVSYLIEELEDIGRSEKRAVSSNLIILLMYLLKYKYQPEKKSNSWLFTIVEHRKRLKVLFKNSPSLKNYYHEVFSETYQDAKDLASAEIGLSINDFPSSSPFTPKDVLNENYLP